jgi:CHASE3 domain sensor protein
VLAISGLAFAIGVVAAFVVLALLRLVGLFTNLFYFGRWSTALVFAAGNHLGVFRVLVPIGGALIIGVMARYGSERIRGHGIPEAIEAILINGSRVEPKVALYLKPLSSAISIGSGGPFGAGGPICVRSGLCQIVLWLVNSTPACESRNVVRNIRINLQSLRARRRTAVRCPFFLFQCAVEPSFPWCEMNNSASSDHSLLNRKIQLTFGPAVLALLFLTLLVVGAVSYRSIIVSQESGRRVRHTHEVLRNLQALFSEVQSMESSYREFVVTGDERSLSPYSESILRSRNDEAVVRNLTSDKPNRRQIPVLGRVMDQKIQSAETVIALRRTEGFAAAADSMREGQDLVIMDELQGVLRGLENEELQLLVVREMDAQRRSAQSKAVLIFGTVLDVFLARRRKLDRTARQLPTRECRGRLVFGKRTRPSDPQSHRRRCHLHRHPGEYHLPKDKATSSAGPWPPHHWPACFG